MMQLDALRAFAVLAVLVGHFIRTTSSLFYVVKLVDLADLSIRRFFVISGFFIIGPVLRANPTDAWTSVLTALARRSCLVRATAQRCGFQKPKERSYSG